MSRTDRVKDLERRTGPKDKPWLVLKPVSYDVAGQWIAVARPGEPLPDEPGTVYTEADFQRLEASHTLLIVEYEQLPLPGQLEGGQGG